MSSIIYQIVLTALKGEDTSLLEYELGEKIANHKVAIAIVESIKQAINEFNTTATTTDDFNFDDYEG